MAILGLSSPWMIYYQKLNSFFKDDPEVNVVYDVNANDIKVYVNNDKKYVALSKLIPIEKDFGNITLNITLIPANENINKLEVENSIEDIYTAAFEGNPALSYIKSFQGFYQQKLTYVVFKKEVVQYYSDNLGTISGFDSTLYENLAREVFNDIDGVYYCTDTNNG